MGTCKKSADLKRRFSYFAGKRCLISDVIITYILSEINNRVIEHYPGYQPAVELCAGLPVFQATGTVPQIRGPHKIHLRGGCRHCRPKWVKGLD